MIRLQTIRCGSTAMLGLAMLVGCASPPLTPHPPAPPTDQMLTDLPQAQLAAPETAPVAAPRAPAGDAGPAPTMTNCQPPAAQESPAEDPEAQRDPPATQS